MGRDPVSRAWLSEWPEQRKRARWTLDPGAALAPRSHFRVWSRELETGRWRPGFEF